MSEADPFHAQGVFPNVPNPSGMLFKSWLKAYQTPPRGRNNQNNRDNGNNR